MRKSISLLIYSSFFIFTIFNSFMLQARVVHVPGDSTTIQGAITGASDGDTVLVSPGTYYEYGIDFQGKAIRLMSRNPADSLMVESTVIHGNSLGVIFFFRNGEDSSSVLDGLTITGGRGNFGGAVNCQATSPVITRNHIRGNISTLNGGGIYVRDAAPLIHDNLIDANTATNAGGGIYFTNSTGRISNNTISGNSSDDFGGGIACENSDPVIANNRITGNSTVEVGGGIACLYSSPTIINNFIDDNSTDSNGGGGGIYCYESSPDILDNFITENWAGVWGGGIYCFTYANPLISGNVITGNSANFFGGGGICTNNCSPTITDNTITGNSADNSSGGGISCYNYSPTITNNSIVGNTTDHWGGGIFCWDTDSPVIANNIIKRNTAAQLGGGISVYRSTVPTFENNTIYRNIAGDGGGAISCATSSTVTMKNTILWDNEATVGPEIYVHDNPAVLTISYSDVDGGEDLAKVEAGCVLNWGAGMIEEDPLFSDDEARLNLLSPCVDGGDPAVFDNCKPPGRGGDTSDMGAHGGNDNCWWPELGITLRYYLPDPLAVIRNSNLTFSSFILNNTQTNSNGDYWISVKLPNMSELVLPSEFSNYANPLSGEVPAFGSVFLDHKIHVPTQVDTGSYSIIGRIGIFPLYPMDEESFGFQVID